MRPVIASTFLLMFVAACATVPATGPAAHAPEIVIAPDAEAGYWRATYELTAPASELRFERTPFRTGVFEAVTEGYTITREGDTDVLRTSGAPAQRIVVRFPEYTRELESEYDFFQKFSDGSVAIYSGHLVAAAGTAGEPIRHFRFVPPPGQHVVAGGAVVNGPAAWTDHEGQGAYIYIGSIVPIETPALVSIIDPGLPSWLWDETRKGLPRLFDLYAERLGVSPLERPLILFNSVDRGGSGYSYGGGTLPGQIQLTIDGAAWKERSDDALLQLLHFLAHESAHLWNGRVILYDGTDDSWMHEGSADALAERALRELGYADRDAYAGAQSEALNACRRGLGSFPLRDAAKRNAFQLYYNCGNALSLYTERAIANHDLFAFWKSLIARVHASGRTTYGPDDYYAAMSSAGASAEDIARLQHFVGDAASADALADMLRAKGLTLTESTPSTPFGQSLARDALLRLLAEHCTGPYGFMSVTSGLALDKKNACGPIPPGAVVTAIGTHDVLHDGAATWNELHDRCASPLPVRLEVTSDGTTRTVEVPCGKPAAAPLPYLRIDWGGNETPPD